MREQSKKGRRRRNVPIAKFKWDIKHTSEVYREASAKQNDTDSAKNKPKERKKESKVPVIQRHIR